MQIAVSVNDTIKTSPPEQMFQSHTNGNRKAHSKKDQLYY